MKYLLDTCTVSDFVKGECNTLERMKNIPPSLIAVSAITVMEINYGLYLNSQRAKKIEKIIDIFLSDINVISFSQDDGKKAAYFRATLKQLGTPIGYCDVLLAGCAVARNLTFITSNVSEFKRIEKLKIENWRLPYQV